MSHDREPAIVRCIVMENDSTKRAVRIRQDKSETHYVDVWIPRSQIEGIIRQGKDLDGNDLAEVEVPAWLADKEGLEYK